MTALLRSSVFALFQAIITPVFALLALFVMPFPAAARYRFITTWSRLMLAGVRVVELAVWVAGPGAGGILADWGADVVKIEPPEGDPCRSLFMHLAGLKEPKSPPFDLDNRGKRSVVLDLRSPDGLALARKLVAGADVFLSNLRPDALAKLGLDFASLAPQAASRAARHRDPVAGRKQRTRWDMDVGRGCDEVGGSEPPSTPTARSWRRPCSRSERRRGG